MRPYIYLFFFILTINGSLAQHQFPMKIGMVSVFVEDPAAAFNYYTQTLGFEEVMFSPENYIAIVRSPLARDGVQLLLEPTEPGGLEIAKKYKKELYELGIPVISFATSNIHKTYEELASKGVRFTQAPSKTDFGYSAVFDDAHGNYIQLYQLKPEPIVVSVELDATVERVWTAITNGEEMKEWYFENIPDFEPRKGFSCSFEIGSDSNLLTVRWKVIETTTHKEIKYSWQYDEFKDGYGTTTWTLSPKGGKTLLTLVNEGLESFPQHKPAFRRESCIKGWEYFLQESLTGYLKAH